VHQGAAGTNAEMNPDMPEYLHQLDPRNYKFLPHKFTEVIRPAGRYTHKSEAIGNLLHQNA